MDNLGKGQISFARGDVFSQVANYVIWCTNGAFYYYKIMFYDKNGPTNA